ncbi:uncharacterized protein ColSpa_10310 [Colletotrichum spaethianum]|uniref:Cyclin-D1-binding protein 1-like N-terminal domain-containing protein n=1 Tax=Colletotrichum spaethianum TaxID=700344 RepID=A0AA37UJQ9_9PEZI|nr:uncharacterized protein ColSpa_10310 [Colletotrichum spaethianum]GKT50129.1 hypothetical protein ColSpa_10310 [Colletotrichum spaethianum]
MAPSTSNTSPTALNALTDTAVALLQQLEAVLLTINSGKDTPQQTENSSVDAFPLARDSASLIKAHSTKISVLIINEPFTPSAIIKVLRELVSGPIPGIATAAQACDAERYTSTVRRDLSWKCYTVLKELRSLVERIPRDGKILSTAQKSGASGTPGKGSMAATGVIWSACDELIHFSNGDNIRDRLESCLKRLRLTTLLYQAIIKRRLKALPSLPAEKSDIPKRLDEAMRTLRKLPHMFDELAGAFYELSPDEIDRVMSLCFNEIVALSEQLKAPWAGETDEFSEWAVKFQAEIKKG